MFESLLRTLLVLVLGALAGLERYAAFQFSILRPFPSAVILSLLLGRTHELLLLGIFFELMWLSRIPVGSTVLPHESLAFYSALITYLVSVHIGIQWTVAMAWAMFAGIVNGIIGKRVDMILREINLRIANWVEENIENDSILEKSLFYALTTNFFVHFIYLSLVLLIAFPAGMLIKEITIDPEIARTYLTLIPFILYASYYFTVRNLRLQQLYIGIYSFALIIFLAIHWVKWLG